jgi:hypothetical protein
MRGQEEIDCQPLACAVRFWCTLMESTRLSACSPACSQGVAVRKELYRQRGLIECNLPRHPVRRIHKETCHEMPCLNLICHFMYVSRLEQAAPITPFASGMLARTIETTVGPSTDITKPVIDPAVIRGEL